MFAYLAKLGDASRPLDLGTHDKAPVHRTAAIVHGKSQSRSSREPPFTSQTLCQKPLPIPLL